KAVRQALIWRHSTLPQARERARQLGLRGAAFPWRTIQGEDCSAYWPAGTAAFHVNAAVAHAVSRYVAATGDVDFEREGGTDLRAAAAAMYMPFDERLGVHPQDQDFTEHALWDFEHTPPDHYPLLLHYPYLQLYRRQVVKQPDLVLALHQRGDAFTPEQKRAD